MHIPAVSNEVISPARLLRQLRETSNEQVAAPSPSAAVSLSTDGRLASLVERLLSDDDVKADLSAIIRLIGEAPQFTDAARRLAALPHGTPDALGALRAVIRGTGLLSLLQTALGETEALPAGVRLYLANGGIAGLRLDAARQPDLFAQPPLQ